MKMILEAVYEQGVLRLTKPLNLPEGTRVEITFVKSETNFQQKKPADILAAIASLPLEGEQDEFSGRDHDRILYPEQDRQ
ncbi:MAG: antitoxin family protein [Okeania sp. SIO2C9]|nr:antitoxin family protein [Okeania sp. SIO2C9]